MNFTITYIFIEKTRFKTLRLVNKKLFLVTDPPHNISRKVLGVFNF